MNESLLQFLWKYRLFNATALRTSEGEPIEVLHPGEQNFDAGPDFFNARIRIGNTTWAGNIELHIDSNDWFRHGHQHDKAYQNIILHVVFRHQAGQVPDRVPLLCLEPHLPASLLEKYQALMESVHWVPCQPLLPGIKPIVLKSWLSRLMVERLQDKCRPLEQILEQNRNHFEETFYLALARSFGFKVNAEAFEQLARLLPLKILQRHQHKLQQVEALLFGVAGMLRAEFSDEYPKALQAEFKFLQHKYNLKELPAEQWKWLRLRPGNFPTIRLAQFAAFIHQSAGLLSILPEPGNQDDFGQYFKLQASAYWDHHYHFDRYSPGRPKKLGKHSVQLLLLNAVFPFLFLYAEKKGQEHLREKIINMLESLAAEQNNLLRGWAQAGIQAENALESQALLKLKKDYCNFTRCLQCAIGKEILST